MHTSSETILKALSETASSINSTLDLDEVLSNIMGKAKELAGGAECQLLLMEEETGRLIIHTPFRLESGLSEGSEVNPEEGITGWVLNNREILNIPDVSKDSRYRRWIPDTKSEIALPLINDGNLIGVMNLESPNTNAFHKDMVEILKTLAAYATTAIRNAELFAKYKKTTQRLAFSKYLASVGEVASELIHWFGNKAGLIIGCAESIRAEAGDNPSIQEDIDIIKRHMSEVLEMKKRILGGSTAEENETIPVADFLCETLKIFDEQTVTLTPPSEELTCQGKREHLKNVIHTIIENSIEACQGQEDFRIEVSSLAEGESTIIRIRDNGPGYPKESLGQLFKPFFSAKKSNDSTGMGLWLCYRTLKMMNGEVRVDGDTGKGLTFNIRLEH